MLSYTNSSISTSDYYDGTGIHEGSFTLTLNPTSNYVRWQGTLYYEYQVNNEDTQQRSTSIDTELSPGNSWTDSVVIYTQSCGSHTNPTVSISIYFTGTVYLDNGVGDTKYYSYELVNSYDGTIYLTEHSTNSDDIGTPLSFQISVNEYNVNIECTNYLAGNTDGNQTVNITITDYHNSSLVLVNDIMYINAGISPAGTYSVELNHNYNISQILISITGTIREENPFATSGYIYHAANHNELFPYPQTEGVKIYIKDSTGQYSQYGILYVKTDDGYIKAKSFNILK